MNNHPEHRAPPTDHAPWAVARTPEDLGRFLNQRRVAHGWTQTDLAEHLGFPVRYLHELESGKNTLAYTRLFSLLGALGVEVRLHPLPSDGAGAPGPATTSDPAAVEWL